MFLTLIREGELVLLPSGRRARVLGKTIHGEVDVMTENGEEFAIKAVHLRHLPGGVDALAASYLDRRGP